MLINTTTRIRVAIAGVLVDFCKMVMSGGVLILLQAEVVLLDGEV